VKISEIIKILEPLPKVGYLVGGVVRDLYLTSIGLEPKRDLDIDILIEGELDPRLKQLPLKCFPNFLTAKLKLGEIEIDFVQARKEYYEAPGALPKVSPGSLIEDLNRRDFTINALLIPIENLSEAPIESLILDYVGGLEDLKKRQLRVFHENSFSDDPTRILRAARYCARIGGDLESNTASLLTSSLSGLSNISSFRIFSEFKRIFNENNFGALDSFFRKYGLYEIFPWAEFEKIPVRGADLVSAYLIKSSPDFLNFVKDAQVSKKTINEWKQLSENLKAH
jgi:tRNA nucleotidyltransferase/poly(A) polymerase